MRKYILLLTLLISCTNTNLDNTSTAETTINKIDNTIEQTSTSTTIEDKLVVRTLEELPEALVRIQVKSTQAELTEEFEIEIFEYEGSGSGFFISSDGYIVTNNHVISGAVSIEIFTQYRSQPYTAKLIGLSECDDLAILKIDIDDAKYLELANEEPKLGQNILAAGFPLGDEEVTYLDGIVSKKQTNGSTSWASIEYAFEHTAEILPGSSGGPIVNDEVKVLGIAYAGNEDRQEFGIPIIVVEDKINDIIQNNFFYSFNANIEQFTGAGLYIYSLEPNSSLRKVGFKGGEIISHINGFNIVNESTLKIYCDAINLRSVTAGIRFKGVNLNDLDEFDVEVSLDGSVNSQITTVDYDSIVENISDKNTKVTYGSYVDTTLLIQQFLSVGQDWDDSKITYGDAKELYEEILIDLTGATTVTLGTYKPELNNYESSSYFNEVEQLRQSTYEDAKLFMDLAIEVTQNFQNDDEGKSYNLARIEFENFYPIFIDNYKKYIEKLIQQKPVEESPLITSTTTTTTLSSKPFFSDETLKVYEDTFGYSGRISKWRKDNITIGIYGTPSSMQERIVKETTVLVNDLIEDKNIYITNSENADIKFYFGPVTSWGSFDELCNIAQVNFDKVYSHGTHYTNVDGDIIRSAYCMLQEDQFNNFSKYGICSDAVSGCAIHKIRKAFWWEFVGSSGKADMNTYGWGYCSGYQTYGSIVLDKDGETYYGDGGPILPCSGCCNCSTPQFSELDKEIIRLHNHPYVANATTIEQVVALLRP